ncbi:peptide-methionine (S)-S-oxide reductase MsrA [Sulfurimonas sp. HSL-1716]|uniref:peptide-methionine (S)-S-oxide reductase MsrA n=1 Tax=Hydrocurvibacter sulfurireducens TaxID=3131937 RepID=UPI0031F89D7A
MKKLVLGGGCFWCIEAVYSNVKGVKKALSGYAGGRRKDPSYEQVCSGATGHAEVVEISYDDAIITMEELLDIFWEIHDPTTLNAQGADVGTQYRSVVFYGSDEEKKKIQDSIAKVSSDFDDKIVTEVAPLSEFYPAERYHQSYFASNPNQGYCRVVIAPKLQKFMTRFPEKLA